MKNKYTLTFSDWFVYLLLAVIWGSSFILMKEGLKVFSFQQVASLRIVIAGLVLSPFALLKIRKINKKIILPAVIYAVLGSCIPAFLFPLGQTHLPSGVAGILNSLTPIFVLLTGILFFRSHYNFYQVIGILIGFGGIALLKFSQGHLTSDHTNYDYAWYLVIATFFYGLSNQVLSRWLSHENPVTITAIAFLMVLPFVSVYLFTTPLISVLQNDPNAWKGFLSVATLSILGTATALPMYNYLAQRTGVLFASTLTFVMPAVALLWGLNAGEELGFEHVIFMLVILTGVYLVRKKSKEPTIETPEKVPE